MSMDECNPSEDLREERRGCMLGLVSMFVDVKANHLIQENLVVIVGHVLVVLYNTMKVRLHHLKYHIDGCVLKGIRRQQDVL